MKIKPCSILSVGAVLALAFLAGCASAPTVRSHADSAVSYENYKTFAMLRPHQVATSNSPDLTPMLLRQTREEAQAAFAAKGLLEVPPQSADLLVLVHGGMEEKVDVTNWGYSYTRLGRGFVGRGGQYELTEYKTGTLLIDAFDAKTKELVWRGTAVSEIGDAPKPETLKATIEAIVARYPN